MQFFICHLNCGVELWGHAAGRYNIGLFHIQKKVLQIISPAGWNEHSKLIFKKMKVLNFYSQPTIYALKIYHLAKS